MYEAIIALCASAVTATATLGSVWLRERGAEKREKAGRERGRVESIYRDLGRIYQLVDEADAIAYKFARDRTDVDAYGTAEGDRFSKLLDETDRILQEIATVQGLYLHHFKAKHERLLLSYSSLQLILSGLLHSAEYFGSETREEMFAIRGKRHSEFQQAWRNYRLLLEQAAAD